MEDSDTPNLSKPKLIPVPGLKPRQEQPPPASAPVDPSAECPEPETPESKEEKTPKIKKTEIRKLTLKKAITPLYKKPEKPARSIEEISGTGGHHIEIPHTEQIPIEEIAPPTLEEKEGFLDSGSTSAQPAIPLPHAPGNEIPPVEEPPTQEPEAEEQTEAEVEEEPEKIKTLIKAKEKSKRSKKPLMYVGGAVLVVILAAAYLILDPFGHNLEPMRPMSPMFSKNTSKPEEAVTIMEPAVEEESVFNPQQLDLDAYLAGLESRHVQAIPNPEGILLEKVFYAKGSQLNPQLGLVIKEIEISPSEVLLTVTDSNSVDHSIPLQRSIR